MIAVFLKETGSVDSLITTHLIRRTLFTNLSVICNFNGQCSELCSTTGCKSDNSYQCFINNLAVPRSYVKLSAAIWDLSDDDFPERSSLRYSLWTRARCCSEMALPRSVEWNLSFILCYNLSAENFPQTTFMNPAISFSCLRLTTFYTMPPMLLQHFGYLRHKLWCHPALYFPIRHSHYLSISSTLPILTLPQQKYCLMTVLLRSMVLFCVAFIMGLALPISEPVFQYSAYAYSHCVVICVRSHITQETDTCDDFQSYKYLYCKCSSRSVPLHCLDKNGDEVIANPCLTMYNTSDFRGSKYACFRLNITSSVEAAAKIKHAKYYKSSPFYFDNKSTAIGKSQDDTKSLPHVTESGGLDGGIRNIIAGIIGGCCTIIAVIITVVSGCRTRISQNSGDVSWSDCFRM